jgi:hypothetical protein
MWALQSSLSRELCLKGEEEQVDMSKSKELVKA